MQLSDFDFELPIQLIAKYPTQQRTHSRLLIGQTPIIDTHFYQIGDYLQSKDLLVINNTQVIPGRLFAHKATGGKLEVMIERVLDNYQALAMIKSNRSPVIGSQIYFDSGQQIFATVLEKAGYLYTLSFNKIIDEVLAEYGHIPLPYYLNRADEKSDQQRYQTVFAKQKGAVAAPTAGLHFDNALLDKIKTQGVGVAEVTLHVGAGTFLPVKTDNITEHKMHKECIEISQETQEKIIKTKQNGGRIIALGTTVVRALESWAKINNLTSKTCDKFSKETDIFIYPKFEFKIVDVLITNFHLPKSSLLMLVSAFAGVDEIRHIYQHAIEQQYRFFSYGDAMLLQNNYKTNK